MPKHAFEFLYYNVTGTCTEKWKADNSAIFWDIMLKFDTGAPLEDVLDSFSAFFEKLKIVRNIFKNIFFEKKNFVIYFH